MTTDWTLPLKVSWTLGLTDWPDSRADKQAGLERVNRPAGSGSSRWDQAQVRPPSCEEPGLWGLNRAPGRAGAAPIGPQRPFRRAARSPEAEGPPRTASPGLAHPTLADDEDLQSGQHVLVHPAPTLLGHSLRPRQRSQRRRRQPAHAHRRAHGLPLPLDVWAAWPQIARFRPEAALRLRAPWSAGVFPGSSCVVLEQMGRAACRSAYLLPGTGSAPALTPPASDFVHRWLYFSVLRTAVAVGKTWCFEMNCLRWRHSLAALLSLLHSLPKLGPTFFK